jgi:putative FmdB family regulatory protein
MTATSKNSRSGKRIMPIYPYRCSKCEHGFEIWAKFSEIDSLEPACPECYNKCTPKERLISPKIHLNNTKVEDAEFCEAFGCVVKNKAHRKKIAKERGLVEVGNEKPETIHKHFEVERKERDKKQEAERYDDVMSALQ